MTRSKSVGSSPDGPVTSRRVGADMTSQCDGHEHFEMDIVDEVFDVDVDEMFTMLFTDSALFSEFTRRRRTYDVMLAPWSDEADEQGRKTRVIRYTLSINYAIGPKCSPSTETQVLYTSMSCPGTCYVIDADCVNGGVPYSDHFSTVVRYCMRRIDREDRPRTRLCITGRVLYHKTVWGFIRNFIQKTAVSGLSESFGVMADLLRQAAASRRSSSLPGTSSLAARPRTLPVDSIHRPAPSLHLHGFSSGRHDDNRRTKRRFRTRKLVDCCNNTYSADTRDAFAVTSSKSWTQTGDTAQLLVALLFIVVLALVVINALLYYQLIALESTVNMRLLSGTGMAEARWVT